MQIIAESFFSFLLQYRIDQKASECIHTFEHSMYPYIFS